METLNIIIKNKEMTRLQAVRYLVENGIFYLNDINTPAMEFYIKTLTETPIDNVFDVDRCAHLNTLFGYDIGYSAALDIDNWLYDPELNRRNLELCALDITYKDKPLIQQCVKELGLDLLFDKWATKEPDVYRYEF